jgi:hypothetical protein
MIHIGKINQLATNLTLNSRMPSNPIIHKLAYDDHPIRLLSLSLEVQNHIVFIVIQPEQTYLITNKLFQSVHCFIVKEVGVILSSNCSSQTEKILEHYTKWAPYKLHIEDDRFYGR